MKYKLKKDLLKGEAVSESFAKQNPDLVEEAKENYRWVANYNNDESYYYLKGDGKVCLTCEMGELIDCRRYDIGNYFQTREEATQVKEKLFVLQQLKDIAMRLNDREIERGVDDTYAIYYNHMVDEFQQKSLPLWSEIGQVYCLSDEFLKTALSEIGEERLKLLLE